MELYLIELKRNGEEVVHEEIKRTREEAEKFLHYIKSNEEYKYTEATIKTFGLKGIEEKQLRKPLLTDIEERLITEAETHGKIESGLEKVKNPIIDEEMEDLDYWLTVTTFEFGEKKFVMTTYTSETEGEAFEEFIFAIKDHLDYFGIRHCRNREKGIHTPIGELYFGKDITPKITLHF